MSEMTKNLSKSVQEALLQDAAQKAQATAKPYEAIAKEIATAVEAQKVHSGKATAERGNLWSAFKRALAVGAQEDHSVSLFRVGLEVACAEAGVPAGSFRGYVTTIANLYQDVRDEKLSMAEAVGLSVGDARKRYRTVSDLQAARQALTEATKDWSAEELNRLASIARGEADEDEALEIVVIGEKHASEAAAALAAKLAKKAPEANAEKEPERLAA